MLKECLVCVICNSNSFHSFIFKLSEKDFHWRYAPSILCTFDWEESFIVCLYKGKGDTFDRGNYGGLKLTEQAMKILERIVDGLIRQVVSIDDSQFGVVPGRGTTDAIFVVRQLQEKYLAVNKTLYMAFVDLDNHLTVSLGRLSEKAMCLGMDCAVSPGNVR